jgi:hypothetical protein
MVVDSGASAASTTAARLTGSPPASGPAGSLRSSTPSTSVSRLSPASRICSSRRRRWAGSARSPSASSSCVKPSTAFSGVRSSWLMREKSTDLDRLSRRASSRSRCARSSDRDSVTSQLTPRRRITLPSASVSATERDAIVRTSPSGRRMRNS